MILKPNNAVQLYHEVRKASGKEIPLHPDFYEVVLESGDKNLVQALNSIDEKDFSSPFKVISSLENLHFKKENSKSKSWAARIQKQNKPKKSHSVHH